MRLDDRDVAALTEWAAAERRNRVIGVCHAPFMPFVWWWLIEELIDFGVFGLELLLGPVALFGSIIAGIAIVDLSRGRSVPDLVLDGVEPTVRYSAVVHCDDGDSPTPLSVRVDVPGDERRRYVHLRTDSGVRLGQRLAAMAWWPATDPFRDGVLLEPENGRRLWIREHLLITERHEVDPC